MRFIIIIIIIIIIYKSTVLGIIIDYRIKIYITIK